MKRSLLRSIGIDIDGLKTTLGDVNVVVRSTAEGVEGIAGDVSEVKTMLLTVLPLIQCLFPGSMLIPRR
jgi:hypothetical protein